MTDFILKVDGVKDALAIELYIERDRVIRINREDFVEVFCKGKVEYYIPVDANKLGRGHLMASVEFEDKELCFPRGKRRVTVNGFTGYSIPCMGEGNTISCGDYEVSFQKQSDIPENEGTHIYVGAAGRVVGYEYITEGMIKSLPSYEAKKQEIPVVAKEGDRFVVSIPYDKDLKAYKDNGFGGRVPFNENIMGANGDLIVKVDGVKHRIYGEFFTTEGNLKIYIE